MLYTVEFGNINVLRTYQMKLNSKKTKRNP